MMWCVLGFLVINGLPDAAGAGDPGAAWVSKVVSIQGRVMVRRQGESSWQPVRLQDTFVAGDQVRVEPDSRAGIVLSNDTVLRLDQNTSLVFTEIENEKTFILRLIEGAANFFSHRPRSLKILTPFVNGVVEGTEFYVRVDAGQTRIDLFEGRILAESPYGSLQLARGEGAVASAGSAPRHRILVHPRDSVQWAMYYPPLAAAGPPDDTPGIGESLALFGQGQTAAAMARLEDISAADRDARFFILRAGLRLHVGRVSEAQSDIARALALDPQNGDALALEAVMAVVHNRASEALELARQATGSAPRSAAAQMALSYALQAGFDLEKAAEAAREAVTLAPGNGLALARLAELQLSLGRLDDGIDTARRAADLSPGTAHAHTILGFAHLTRIETGKAREAFDRAIALDSAAPLPRLGRGLTTIRDGDLEQGRSEIEIAAGLDPGNAMIRSYLGKAYFDEKRGPMDGQQFDIAKSLDPFDPTPWFYDAIRKQSLNRPVEALQDLQQSIARNDNRAVYRSRLMLDQDLAARSAALGRIYNNLSFQELARREGAKSLGYDPTDYSAHRLLSDIYAGRQRLEIARVSELLQSQLLQPINLIPVQPQSAESTLMAPETAGPQSAAWNELNPLFTRNRTAFNIDALLGSNGTAANDLSLSGLVDRFSYSLGQHHYETRGFRPNNDLEKDIASAFAQVALSPNTSIQAEYRYRDVTHGDIALNWDPEDYSENRQVSRRENIPRLGIRHSLNSRHHFIGSLIYNQTDYDLNQHQIGPPGPAGPIIGTESRVEEDDAYNAEGQYIFRGNRLKIIAGAGYYEQDISEAVTTIVTSGPIILGGGTVNQDSENRHANGYAYAYINPFSTIDITVGLSGDDLETNKVDVQQFNPKFGISWHPTSTLTIRGTAFRTLKRSLVTNQTIEPTQISGFTQLFDDMTATDAKRYGLGLDYQIIENLSFGTETTFNDLARPIGDIVTGEFIDEDYEEYHHRSFLYWATHPQVAVSAEYLFDQYQRDFPETGSSYPYELETHSFPLTVSYFHTSGLSAKIRGTYINQRVKQWLDTALPDETLRDDFTLVDLHFGYRLPNRYGLINLSITNVFDTHFNYQDLNFLTSNEQDPGIKPERQIFLSASFNF
jgi:tetratricopeptide (TPR) repeat protein